MAGEASRSAGSADSYIGSLISLTSKFEIRYEGILYNINTEESSIGLINVRSFGTEGRKKDGPQIPASDKVYEYILFRGSDIKDLQVKSSPPVQTPPTFHSDPAIIQSHYSQPAPVSSTVPSSVGGAVTDPSSHTLQMGLPADPSSHTLQMGLPTDPSSHTLQMGLPRSTFQGGLPLYQPGVSLRSWGSSPAPPSSGNGGGLAMPMYWQGFYGPSNGLSHLQQQSLLHSTPGLLTPPPSQQPAQYPGSASIPLGSSNMPASIFPAPNLPSSTLGFPPFLLPPVSSGPMNLTFGNLAPTMLSNIVPSKSSALASSETLTSLTPHTVPVSVPSTASLNTTPTLVSQLINSSSDVNPIVPTTSKPGPVPGMSMPYQAMPQSVSTVMGVSNSHQTEMSTPSLLTPDQLLQPAQTSLSSSLSLKMATNVPDVASASSSLEPPILPLKEAHAPLLPLPSHPNRKLNGAPILTHHGQINRGRGRGRGDGILHPVTKFTEDFDFMAMNEKFKKDEVWGDLGKTIKISNKEGDDNEEDGDDSQDDGVNESSNSDEKPVYVKDDFFDSLSCNSLDRGQRNGRAKFSEQMKIDTETFGDFPRYRGGRGGRVPGRGGRSRGSYYGRGAYAYVGRGRGQGQNYY